MTNYESAAYNVVDSNEDSITYETLPGRTTYTDDKDAVMKVWRTAFLPDGQPISIAVEHSLEDVRGLQSWLNDQFGRGQARIGAHAPAVQDVQLPEPGEPYAVDPEQLAYLGPHVPYDPAAAGLPVQPDYTPGPEAYNLSESIEHGEAYGVASASMAEPSDFYGGAADSANIRRCPVIYNGEQCSRPEGHSLDERVGHFFYTQTSDGVATPPADVPTTTPGATGGEQAAASATAAGTAEAAPSDAQPARKKTVRRKKEELEYDKALETFRSQPDSQLNYTDLVKAADALRKRFPDNHRLVTYDLHIQHQDVKWLTDPTYGQITDDPAKNEQEQNSASSAAGQNPPPHFAPEEPAAAQPTPSVPPVAMQPADVQSPEEVQAAAAFPCQFRSETSGRQCTRPAGHELANPPKPHIFAELQPGQSLPAVPNFIPAEPPVQQAPGFTVTPVGEGSGFSQTTIPPFQIPQPQAQPAFTPPAASGPVPGQQLLSFQVPPLPEGEQQPTAPAAPWGP